MVEKIKVPKTYIIPEWSPHRSFYWHDSTLVMFAIIWITVNDHEWPRITTNNHDLPRLTTNNHEKSKNDHKKANWVPNLEKMATVPKIQVQKMMLSVGISIVGLTNHGIGFWRWRKALKRNFIILSLWAIRYGSYKVVHDSLFMTHYLWLIIYD